MAGKFMWPVPGFYRVSSGFRTEARPDHAGMDIGRNAAPPECIEGARVVAVAGGIVIGAGALHKSKGNWLEICHAGGWASRYMHNLENLVGRGDAVRMGDAIALVGNTGRSFGPHLHVELIHRGRHVDPFPHLCRHLAPPGAGLFRRGAAGAARR